MKPADFDPSAENEYLAAIHQYEQQRIGLGLDFQSEIESAIKEISRQPDRFPYYNVEPVRQCIVRRFPYSEMEDRIWIIAIAHHKRKPGYWAHRKLKPK